MRVLQINSIFSAGGVDTQTLELCRGLMERGVEVALAIRGAAGMRSQARRLTGLTVHALPESRVAFARGAARVIRRWAPQIVHAHHGRDYWPAILASRFARRGSRVVVSRHLMGRNRLITRWGLLHCADMVAVSDAVRDLQAASLHGPRARLHRVYGGIDTSRFQPVGAAAGAVAKARFGWSVDAVVFAVLGFFHPPRGKGQMEFLRAAASLYEGCRDARFLIVGAGDLLPRMQEFIAGHGLEGVARIEGWQSDVMSVLAGVDVVVYPAIDPEALPVVPWEALAAGIPVIASRVGGLGEAFVQAQHGLFVPPADVPALTAAMHTLAEDAAVRRRYGASGREYVLAERSTASYAARMLALYDAVLRHSRDAVIGCG
ncbi:MAG TPA: glycosyltransferase family 4 protein [Nevskiaceae bacterium]